MKNNSLKKNIFIAFLFFLLLNLLTFSQEVNINSNSKSALDGYQKDFKIEHSLYKVIKTFNNHGLQKTKELHKFSKRVQFKNNLIRVIIKSQTSNISTNSIAGKVQVNLQSIINSFGGFIEAHNNNSIQTLLPLKQIKILSDIPTVSYIRLPLSPHLHVVSEGVKHSNADKFQSVAPFHSNRTVKLAVIDSGFNGYQDLLGSELPSNLIARSFRQDEDITGNGISHGTACAEVVHDMAPDAQLYLINYDYLSELISAIDWLASQGVTIISCSLGYYNAGPGNGTGPINDIAEYAIAKGMAWINSSGNDAETHWEAKFTDNDKDGFLDFGGDNILTFKMPAYAPMWVYMNWNDWGTWDGSTFPGSSNDYDLYLYIQNPNTKAWIYVGESESGQNGKLDQWPVEDIAGYWAAIDAKWGVKIKKNPGAIIKKIELFFNFNGTYDLETIMSQGSVTSPSDSEQVISVGAVPWENELENFYYLYSSQGPTSDGRIKPDIATASRVSNATYGMFGGTSASAPHVAGAIALLYNKTPFTIGQIIQLIFSRADDWGVSGKDNIFGFGKLDLDD